ncbi:MAG TPA: Mpo1-like protein [Terriglobales bacterium]
MSANAMDRLWSDYQEHHRTAGNRTCHLVGIPLIIIGLLGLLAIPIAHAGGWPIEVSLLIVLLVGAIDIWLDAKLGLLMFLASFVIYLGARMLAWQVLAGLFVLGWVFQFVGHGAYEKRSPAFYRNLAHLMVGPLWVLNHLVHLRGETAQTTASARG